MAFFDEITFDARDDWKDDPRHEPAPEGETIISAADLLRFEQTIAAAVAALQTLREHKHAAGDITSGTLAVARVPNLAISKITGLQDALDGIPSVDGLAEQSSVDALAARITALENAGGGD